MSELVGLESSNCSNGHKLIGWVKHCPFCGEKQVKKATSVPLEASDVRSEPAAALEDKKPQIDPKKHKSADTGKVLSVNESIDREVSVSKEIQAVPGSEHTDGDVAKVSIKEKAVASVNVTKGVAESPADHDSNKVDSVENHNKGSSNGNEKVEATGDVVSKPKPQGTNWGLIFLIVALLVLGGGYLFTSSDKNTPCLDKLRVATEQMGSGQLSEANGTASQALAICQGESLNKASALKKEIKQLVESDANCQKLFAKVQSLQQRRLLTAAKDTLLNGDSICVVNPNGKNLNESLTNLIDQSKSQIEEVEVAIRGGDQAKAKEVLAALKSAHADNPKLQELQVEISRMATGVVTPVPAVNDTREPKQAPVNGVVASPVMPAQASSPDKDRLIQKYLEKAEIALKQNQFDTAKTQVENAIELDDKNQAARQMWQKIKSAEKAYLENTVIFK